MAGQPGLGEGGKRGKRRKEAAAPLVGNNALAVAIAVARPSSSYSILSPSLLINLLRSLSSERWRPHKAHAPTLIWPRPLALVPEIALHFHPHALAVEPIRDKSRQLAGCQPDHVTGWEQYTGNPPARYPQNIPGTDKSLRARPRFQESLTWPATKTGGQLISNQPH